MFFAAELLAGVGLCVLLLNAYGVIRGLEVKGIQDEHVHFRVAGERPTFNEFVEYLHRGAEESETAYASRLTRLVGARILHIHWHKYPPGEFDQRVPARENWLLWMLGLISRKREHRRYHFTDWRRSCKRGIGVCGDKSMVLEQLLHRAGIACVIVSNRRHVMVQATLDGTAYCLDPDYGVLIPLPFEQIERQWKQVATIYREAGANEKNMQDLQRIFSLPSRTWKNTKAFAFRRYVFERVSYVMKWMVPMLMLLPTLAFSF